MSQDMTSMTGYEANHALDEADTGYASFRLSWLAYLCLIRILLVYFFVFGVLGLGASYVVSAMAGKEAQWPMGFALVLTILMVAYQFVSLRKVVIYTDQNGVWVQQGVFPWEKAVSGVKWCDVSEATYTPGFFSWVLRSYSVRVGHRFTHGAEVHLANVHQGNRAVEHINSFLLNSST